MSVDNGKVFDGAFMVDGEDFAPVIRTGEIIVETIAGVIRAVILLVFFWLWLAMCWRLFIYTHFERKLMHIKKGDISDSKGYMGNADCRAYIGCYTDTKGFFVDGLIIVLADAAVCQSAISLENESVI